MFKNLLRTQRAHEILKLMCSENICKDRWSEKLREIRKLSEDSSQKFMLPVLTDHVAVTLCGFGLSGELTRRFALEYALTYKEKNVGVVMFNGDISYKETSIDAAMLNRIMQHNHTIAYIGTPKIPDDIDVEKGREAATIIKSTSYTVEDFFSDNPDCVWVDPLLGIAGTSNFTTTFLDYCIAHELTHVASVQDYATTVGFAENTRLIKDNAEKIAKEINSHQNTPQLSLMNEGLFGTKKPSQGFPQDGFSPKPPGM